MRIAVMVLALGLMLIVGFQSCAASFAGSMTDDASTSAAAGMGFFVVFLFLIAGAFAISFPIVSLVAFVLAGTVAIAAGLSSDFADLTVWGFLAFILTIMSYFGHREKKRRRAAEQQRVR